MATPAALAAGLIRAADLLVAPPDLIDRVGQAVVAASVPLTPILTGALRASEVNTVAAPDQGTVQATVLYARDVFEGTGTHEAKGPRPFFEWGWEAAQPAIAVLLEAHGTAVWQQVAA